MWSDSDTDVDFLNYSEVAEMVVDLLSDPKLLPLSVGVFGGWGIGKSTTLRLVERELDKAPDRYLVIKFDAWMYQDFDDARAALMSVISGALVKAAPPALKDRAKSLIGRVNKLRFLGVALEAGAWAMGVPTFGAISKGVTAAGALFSGSEDDKNLEAVKDAASDVESRGASLLREPEERGPPDEIDAFRAEFKGILQDLGKTMVVFIDNLDRCLPRNAIETMEAVRLFLFMPNSAFVVAADEDMIRHAVSQHFNSPSQRHITDYLDKLIQVPVRVPRAGIQEVRAYLILLLASRSDLDDAAVEKLRQYLIDRLRTSWKDDGDFTIEEMLTQSGVQASKELAAAWDMADRMAPILALSPGVLGNPRTVKRMLNVVRMRANVARRRAMPIDEAMITKLALFERCTDIDATEELHNLINASPRGKPAVLASLEQAKPGETIADLPEKWTKHAPFLMEWAKLAPGLAGVDLRPAVYLARETVPLRMRSGSLAGGAAKAVETLLQIRSVSSPAAKAALDSLQPGDMILVMEAVIEVMRKDSDWSRARMDFRGATLVADRSAAAAELLNRFFRSLQLPKTPGWVSTMLKDKAWWEE
ncbi:MULTISPECIES: P-loop NTPase fold protein [Mesorhizobium]|uniref:KAP family P-loop NTPase fold protein n=3 Tax=Phyllobacteriaceae TaxID=69277 RepID=UPI0003CE3F7C|nr:MULTISPECIES: P-loop NTPase fold protein [unclassified Mesorhizobium]ESY56063.1 NTPase KAP [Mesorhizobium sp. LNJC374B00]ESY61201.1 NTPase KAP [Mesorhizobium sp. LNJC372A00]ESY89572.1 NTPase KAP [Mesorhizobium sp. LNHC209A00]WJI87401.1 P-loop NTPase fold protein [Mesorhizobium sp. C372A]